MPTRKLRSASPAHVLQALCRSRLDTFIRCAYREVSPVAAPIEGWHVEVIAGELEQVRIGQSRRLLINAPPRTFKSFCGSVAFPIFALGNDPRLRILVLSATREQINDLRERVVQLLSSSRVRALFPHLRPDLVEGTSLSHGGRLMFGVYGNCSVRDADIIVVDEPMRPDHVGHEADRREVQGYFDTIIVPHLNATGCRFVMLMKRLHSDDLTAHVLRRSHHCKLLSFAAVAERNEVWDLPDGREHRRAKGEALQPGVQGLDELKQLLFEMNASSFSGLYQQKPYEPYHPDEITHKWKDALVPLDWCDEDPWPTCGFVNERAVDVLAERLFDLQLPKVKLRPVTRGEFYRRLAAHQRHLIAQSEADARGLLETDGTDERQA